MIDDKFSSFYRNVCWHQMATDIAVSTGIVVYGNGECHSIPADAVGPDADGILRWRDEGAPGEGLNVEARPFSVPYNSQRLYVLYQGTEPLGVRTYFDPEEFVLLNSGNFQTQPGYPVPNTILGLHWERILAGGSIRVGQILRRDRIILRVPAGAANVDGIRPHALLQGYTMWPPAPRGGFAPA